jgi:transcriptional regulator with XRE-family HTH domain
MPEVDPAELDRLGNAIRVRRHTLRLSQERAARSAGMHRNYVGALERGEINPTYGTLLRISTGLQIPLDLLIAKAQGDEEDEPTQQRATGKSRSRARSG